MSKIIRGLKNPALALRYIGRESQRRTIYAGSRYYMRHKYGGETNVFTEDWDNLLILDACRYDIFADIHSLPGSLERRLSVASATLEWLENTVGKRHFHETVYVTANPRVNRYEGQFHKIIPAWKTDWDEELKVTPPEPLVELTLEAVEDYPDKRVVTHFMQPHIPFIGEFGRSQIGIYDGTTKGVNRAQGENYSKNTDPYNVLAEGNLAPEDVQKAYRENLELTLPAVKQLLNELDGKTVVTSDHGEMFGEIGWPLPKRFYGHPLRTPAKNLLEVPYLEYTNGPRRNITAEPPDLSDQSSADESVIEERLEKLGYK